MTGGTQGHSDTVRDDEHQESLDFPGVSGSRLTCDDMTNWQVSGTLTWRQAGAVGSPAVQRGLSATDTHRVPKLDRTGGDDDDERSEARGIGTASHCARYRSRRAAERGRRKIQDMSRWGSASQ